MKKSIAIYCNDEVISAVLRDAITAIADALSIDLDIHDGGGGDIILCAAPYDYAAAAAYAETHKLSFFLYWGAVESGQEDIFDYKFRSPLRVGSLMDRLSSLLQGKSNGQVQRVLDIKDWDIFFPESMLKAKGDAREVELTDREGQILRALYLAAGEGIARQELLDHVWDYHQDVETHTLETHIYRLRQKLEQDPSAPEILVTSDAGYVLKR
tara:strand:+ start:163427 stop:164062 length:636 start_codon:yes stop_codon:yes gene_type:complete